MSRRSSIVVVVLKIKGLSVPKLIDRARTIVSLMTDNVATFPKPAPTLAQMTAKIDALVVAQADFKNHTGTKPVRDERWGAVIVGLGRLKNYVARVANANPEHAELIASHAAMTLWKRSLHNKAHLAVRQQISSLVELIAKAIKGAKVYEWQYSLDGGKTLIDLEPTTKASTTIHGLTPGTFVTYHHRVVTKAGRSDWAQKITVMVT